MPQIVRAEIIDPCHLRIFLNNKLHHPFTECRARFFGCEQVSSILWQSRKILLERCTGRRIQRDIAIFISFANKLDSASVFAKLNLVEFERSYFAHSQTRM